MLGLIEAFASGKKTNLTAGVGTSGALYGILSGEIPLAAGVGVILLMALAATFRAALQKIETQLDALTSGDKK